MRRYVLPVLTALAILAVGGAGLAAGGPPPGVHMPSRVFTLDEHDKLIAEAPGCYASCVVAGRGRSCTLRDLDCKVVCMTLVECKPDGVKPMQACAIVRERL